jgi:hypothetical protein
MRETWPLGLFGGAKSNRCGGAMGFGDFHAIETTKAECLGTGVEESNGNIPAGSN